MVQGRERMWTWVLSYLEAFLLSRQVEGLEGGRGSLCWFSPPSAPKERILPKLTGGHL